MTQQEHRFTFQHSWTLTPTADPRRTWIAGEAFMLPIAARECLVRNRRTGEIAVATPETYALLQYCRRFRTLDDHVRTVCSAIPELSGRQPWARQQLEGFCRAGILEPADAIVRSWQDDAAAIETAPSGGRVTIRTCERPHLLQRLLSSIGSNAAVDASAHVFEVLDDSRTAIARQRNREACEQAGSRLRIRYRNLAEGSGLLSALESRFAGARSEIAWLLGAGRDGATYGRPVNWSLLLHAGQRFLSVDDDVIIDPRRSPVPCEGFAVSSAPDRLWFYADREEILRDAPSLALDPFVEHLAVLGRSLREVLEHHAPSGVPGQLCRELASEDLPRLDRRSHVMFTQNGVLGDSGMALHPHALYTVDDDAFARFTSSATAYRQYTRSRCNWRGQPGTRLATARALTFSTVAGIDNRLLLPPTAREFRNEDLLLGDVASFMYPHALMLDLPWSLLHFRDPEKEWMALGAPDVHKQDVLHVLLEIVADASRQCRAEGPEARLDFLGHVMLDWASASDARLREYLEEHLIEHRTRIGFALREQLERHPDAPVYWRKDVEDYLRGPNMRFRKNDLAEAAADIEVVRATLSNYGRALAVWPALWQHCRDRLAS